MNEIIVTDNVVRNFWKHVKKEDGCWEWQAAINWLGYGRMMIKNTAHRFSCNAHRVSWEIHNGKIPEGMYVLHTCNNRRCVRPDHLYLGTQKENTTQAYRDGNLKPQKGEAHPRHKLTDGQVREIRKLKDILPIKTLALSYGVSTWTIHDILDGRHWVHLL